MFTAGKLLTGYFINSLMKPGMSRGFGIRRLTPPERIGYLFTIVAGAAPVGFSLPTGAIEPDLDGNVSLFWDDQATDDQDPVTRRIHCVIGKRVLAYDPSTNLHPEVPKEVYDTEDSAPLIGWDDGDD